MTGVEQLKVNDDVASTYLTVHSQIAFCLVFFLCACVCNKCLTGVEQLKANDDVVSTYSTVHSYFCFGVSVCVRVCENFLTGVEQLKVNNDVASTYSTLLHDDAASRHSPANETQVIYIDIYMKYFHTLYVT